MLIGPLLDNYVILFLNYTLLCRSFRTVGRQTRSTQRQRVASTTTFRRNYTLFHDWCYSSVVDASISGVYTLDTATIIGGTSDDVNTVSFRLTRCDILLSSSSSHHRHYHLYPTSLLRQGSPHDFASNSSCWPTTTTGNRAKLSSVRAN